MAESKRDQLQKMADRARELGKENPHAAGHYATVAKYWRERANKQK
jgi:hypothetical protein